MSILQRLLASLPRTRSAPAANAATFAMPRMAQNPQSIFDMLRPGQQPQFNVTPASGTRPKNYVPTQVSMSGIPVPMAFAMPGAAALPQNPFTVTAASGTKPKNYTPTQIQMNAPTVAGPQAMQQMLAMMNRGVATPFAPFGQG